MAILASVIVDRAELLLKDAGNVRWSAAELLGWLNDGQRETVRYKPEAYTKNEAVQLAAGTKQSIPAAGILLLDVVRNMGTTGTTPGDAITPVSREVLNAQSPSWHSGAASSVVKHYTFNPAEPKRFYVWPKSNGTNYVEIVYSAVPTDVTLTDPIVLDDTYATTLLDYVLYRAYSIESEDGAVTKAALHYRLFMTSLGLAPPAAQ